MFRKITLLLSLVMAMGSAVSTSAAAQDVPASPSDVEGLETGYVRTYMPDFEAMVESVGTPGAEMAIDEENLSTIVIAGFTFDSEDNAANAIDTFGQGFSGEMSGSDDLESSEIDDLGDQAILYSGEIEEAEMAMATNTLIVQDGASLYMVMLTGGELDAGNQQVQDIAQFMLDGEIETEEVTLNADGTSTGGVFDLMPTADDADLVNGLTPSTDTDMMGDMGV